MLGEFMEDNETTKLPSQNSNSKPSFRSSMAQTMKFQVGDLLWILCSSVGLLLTSRRSLIHILLKTQTLGPQNCEALATTNATMLNLLRDSFVTYCGFNPLKRLVYPVTCKKYTDQTKNKIFTTRKRYCCI